MNKAYHGHLVLGGGRAVLVELETLLDLLPERLTKLGVGVLGKVVNSRGNCALVGKETGDAALVLLAGSANEGRVVDETVLGSVALGLQGTEKSLFGTEDLDGRGGVLGEVGQAAGLGNETSRNGVTDESSQVGCNNRHLVN